VESFDEAKAFLLKAREENHQARHFCYGYISPPPDNEVRFSDDGEPAHTAGTPIIHAIQSSDLQGVFVVVIRYFGGTKLGRTGLINAYKSAAILALQDVGRTTIIPTSILKLEFPYSRMQEIQTHLNRTGIKPIEVEMMTKVKMKLKVELCEIRNWEDYLQTMPEVIFEVYN
jgi:uncharacterized YigZ family protein